MTTRTLHLAKNLLLPLEAVTQKLAFLGVTGSGKTYGASKLAELFFHLGAQFIVLDPVGVWYGLRLAKDGKKPSAIDIPIFGGLHGDVPLEATAGELLANLVVDKTLSAVIDVSQFESDAQKARFAHDFAQRFFFRKKAAPSAVHLFIEECQEFVPQNPQRGEEQMLHAFIRMQKLGRNFGIGSSYISQRPQEVNKKALNMAQTLFVFRTTGTHERKAIEQWIADKSLDQDIAGDLPKIQTGHCHVWSPEFLKISETVHILEKETFNASATPEIGVAAKARELAPIDLERVRADMAATIEKAKADDPRELRRQIAELGKQVAKLSTPGKIIPTGINSPAKVRAVLTDADRELLAKWSAAIADSTRKAEESLKAAESRADRLVQTAVAEYLNTTRSVGIETGEQLQMMVDRMGIRKILDKLASISGPQPSTTPASTRRPLNNPAPQSKRAQVVSPRTSRGQARPAVEGEDSLPSGERTILTAIAQYPDGVDRSQLSILTGYKRSTRDRYIQFLQQKGFARIHGDRVLATNEGLAALGDFEPLPIGDALAQHWLRELPDGERRVLQILLAASGKPVDREAIGEGTGYKRSTRDRYIQFLQARKIVVADRDGVRASEELFD